MLGTQSIGQTSLARIKVDMKAKAGGKQTGCFGPVRHRACKLPNRNIAMHVFIDSSYCIRPAAVPARAVPHPAAAADSVSALD